MNRSKSAFTLIEMMVSVMIISIVIMALLQMQGNNTHMFLKLKSNLKINQYASYLVSNKYYGFDKEEVSLAVLLEEFRVEDDLRRSLKNIKVHIDYEKLDRFSDNNGSDIDSTDIVLEVGKTMMKVDKSIVSIIRLNLK